MTSSELQKQKVERLAAEQGITVAEYKRRCDENTAKNQGLSCSDYRKKRIAEAARKKNMTVNEYQKTCSEKVARNKGFRNRKEYDLAGKRAKKFNMAKEEYVKTLKKDDEGFYVLPNSKTERQKIGEKINEKERMV